MKYFEKNAGILKAISKGFLPRSDAVARIDRLGARTRTLRSKIELSSSGIPTIKQQKKIDLWTKSGIESNYAINRMDLAKLGSTTSPLQGTMLNVQTRTAQRKYKSKVLGKKKADILVPLWR